MKKIFQIIGIVLLIFIYFKGNYYWYNLFPKGAKFGISFNEERKKRGILILPNDWTTGDNASLTKMWAPPDGKKDSTFRSMKLYKIEQGEIIFEEDHVIHKVNGLSSSMSIIYHYDSASTFKYYYFPAGADTDILIDKHAADSVLKKWGSF